MEAEPAENETTTEVENTFHTNMPEEEGEEEMVEEWNEQGRDAGGGYRVQDEIKDNFMERQEEHEDGVVRRHYAYSDGYFRRLVTYIADQNGFRVTEMKVKNTRLIRNFSYTSLI